MDKFAKTFESDEYGQLVAFKGYTVDNDGDLPHIEVYCKPDMMGVCSNKVSYEDSDKGEQSRNKHWNSLDLDGAEKIVKPVFDQAEKLVGMIDSE